jgi:hypothetical protein
MREWFRRQSKASTPLSNKKLPGKRRFMPYLRAEFDDIIVKAGKILAPFATLIYKAMRYKRRSMPSNILGVKRRRLNSLEKQRINISMEIEALREEIEHFNEPAYRIELVFNELVSITDEELEEAVIQAVSSINGIRVDVVDILY